MFEMVEELDNWIPPSDWRSLAPLLGEVTVVLSRVGLARKVGPNDFWAPKWATDLYYILPYGKEIPVLEAAARCEETRRAVLALVDVIDNTRRPGRPPCRHSLCAMLHDLLGLDDPRESSV